MPLWFAAVLGIVQGLTEFIPVSSTAHLRLIPALLGRPDPGAAFTAVIQLGTLVAVLVYFMREIGAMGRGIAFDRGGADARLALAVVLGTVPIGICGLLFKDYVTGDLRSLWVVAVALIVVGIAMWGAERIARQDRTLITLTLADALIIGGAQALALVPGVSRSGATITAALLVGLRRDDAARFSFLLSIPAIGAAGVFELPDALRQLKGTSLLPLIVATVVSGVVGYLSIAWLLKFLQRSSLASLVYYRLAVGGLIIALLSSGILSATR